MCRTLPGNTPIRPIFRGLFRQVTPNATLTHIVGPVHLGRRLPRVDALEGHERRGGRAFIGSLGTIHPEALSVFKSPEDSGALPAKIDGFLQQALDHRKRRLTHINTYTIPGIGRLTGTTMYALRGAAYALQGRDVVVLGDHTPKRVKHLIGTSRRRAGLAIPFVVPESDFRRSSGGSETAAINGDRLLPTINRVDRNYAVDGDPVFEVQEILDHKLRQQEVLEEIDVPVARAPYRGRAQDVRESIEGLEGPLPPGQWTNTYFAKEVRSAGGSGVRAIKTYEDLRDFLTPNSEAKDDVARVSEDDAEVLVQEDVPGPECSINFYITPDGPIFLVTTDQIVHGTNHAGNRVPSEHLDLRDIENAYRAAYALFEGGYRGFCGLDFKKPTEGNDRQARAIEINLRKTGVTAPLMIALQLGFTGFVNQQYKFDNLDQIAAFIKEFNYTPDDRPYGGVLVGVYPDNGRYKAEFVALSPSHVVEDQETGNGRDIVPLIQRWFLSRNIRQPADPGPY